MANHESAKKRAKQNIKRKARNKSLLSNMRGQVRSFVATLLDTKVEPAKLAENFKEVQSVLHRSVTKGLLHKNTAARKISRLSCAMVKNLASRG